MINAIVKAGIALVLLFCCPPMPGAQVEVSAVPNDATPLRLPESLYKTLNKVFIIEFHSEVLDADEQSPFVPRLCWKAFRPDVSDVMRKKQAFDSYRGVVRWFMYAAPGGLTCLTARNLAQGAPLWVGYAPTDGYAAELLDKNRTENFHPPTKAFIEKALLDIPNLCSYLVRTLGLENATPKRFDHDFRQPPSKSEVVDFLEPGYIHNVWVARDPDLFAAGRHEESSTAKLLHFSLTSDELTAINGLVLRYSKTDARDYSLLSRVLQVGSGFSFQQSEIEALRAECLRARIDTTQMDAIRGLDKVILICNWASKFGWGLYFHAP
ncbi:MAG: hypothetical protein WB987_09245 [Candidatus Acidiferrales bacterium]